MAHNADLIEHLGTTSELIRFLITESKVKMQAVQISVGFLFLSFLRAETFLRWS